MENINNEKFNVLTKNEMSEIEGGAYWSVWQSNGQSYSRMCNPEEGQFGPKIKDDGHKYGDKVTDAEVLEVVLNNPFITIN